MRTRWLAGSTAAAAELLIAAAVAVALAGRHVVPVGQSGWVSYLSQQVVGMAIPVAGWVLASRRPANPLGWLFLTAGLALGVSTAADACARRILLAHHGPAGAGRTLAWLANTTWIIPVAMLAFLFLLFPAGRLPSRRWRGAAWGTAAAFALAVAAQVAASTRAWAHPYAESHGSAVLDLLTAVPVSAALLVTVVALVVRFARSTGEERLQLKWCAAAGLVLAVVFVAVIWVNTAVANVAESLAFLALWTAIAVSVLKYRLYEIDKIISRTLAYAIVTGLLVGVYAGLVLLATQVLRFHTPVAVAASTLAAAALFAPVRRRVQRAVDRRFNRARYDAELMLTAFAARLQDATDLDAVRTDLAHAVDRALEPDQITVWITN